MANADDPDAWRHKFHRLWTKAVGSTTYVKTEWLMLERAIEAAIHYADQHVTCSSCGGAGEGPLITDALFGPRETVCATCNGSGKVTRIRH